MTLADRRAEAGQVADHFVPAVPVGIVPKHTVGGGAAMAALIVGIQGETRLSQCGAEAGVASAVLGHAMRQHDHGPWFGRRHPGVDVQASVIMGVQPKSIVFHGVSLAL